MQPFCRNKTASSILRHKYGCCKQMDQLPAKIGSFLLAMESAVSFIDSVGVIAFYS